MIDFATPKRDGGGPHTPRAGSDERGGLIQQFLYRFSTAYLLLRRGASDPPRNDRGAAAAVWCIAPDQADWPVW